MGDAYRRAVDMALDRFTDGGDDDPALDVDVTTHLTHAELRALFDALEDGELAAVDRILEAVEGRAPWPDDEPSEVTQDTKGEKALRSHRGNAETLRRYWSIGAGGAKIRWNTPGDFTRCVKYVRKYMPDRVEGYCANLHHRNTGVWPGSRLNVGRHG